MTELKPIPSKYDTDSPETKEQAEALLKQYYKDRRLELKGRPNLLSWKLNDDGIMVLVDGASGRKLEFVTNEAVQERLKAEETAEDAESALLDAEARADEAEAKAAQAQAQVIALENSIKAAKKAEAKAEPEKGKAKS
jgi:phage terminase Nu1 subunit (DNA packaging protein)